MLLLADRFLQIGDFLLLLLLSHIKSGRVRQYFLRFLHFLVKLTCDVGNVLLGGLRLDEEVETLSHDWNELEWLRCLRFFGGHFSAKKNQKKWVWPIPGQFEDE